MLATVTATKKTPAKKAAPKKTPAKAKRKTFAEVGREAAREAQRRVLLEELDAQGWNLSATAEALGMGALPAVIRALKSLALDEYEKAKADGRVSPRNRR